MTAKRDSGPVTPAQTEPEDGLRLRLRGLCSACRQIFGMPDYERYLAHAAQRHPGAPLLTRGEFFSREVERRYGKGGARCC
jgi:uncharacterized short protein YbdD (DUF466 family)